MGRQGEASVQSVHQACFHCQHEGLFFEFAKYVTQSALQLSQAFSL